MKVFSFGGGVQSTAALVLAAQGTIDYQTFLFCNVGEDSENPATLRYVRDIAFPYAKEHGIEMIELERHTQTGERETVYHRMTRPDSRSIGIPVYMSTGAPARRACTVDFKIRLVARWLKAHGASKHCPATVGLGISLDEWQRMRSESDIAYERLAYPLIDLRLDRVACMRIIEQAELPIPAKSSCWFCPFHSLRVWQEMRQSQPEMFAKAVALEQSLNERRAKRGKNRVWLTNKRKPLDQVTTDLRQSSLFDEDSETCESGYCMV